ncbi:MAG TPA: hypothetical protein EYP29_01565 [Thermoplasmata archaeon]|nr:hypothetical protein [Thermoplasmata archaeon]
MSFLKLSECCKANLDTIVLVPSAFERDGAEQEAKPFEERLTFEKSGKRLPSPFFFYFSHTPYKKEVKERLSSIIKVIIERKMAIFGEQHTYRLITGNLVLEEKEDVIEAVEYVEEEELRQLFVSQITPDRKGVHIHYLTKNFGIELKLGMDREPLSEELKNGAPSHHLDIRNLNELRSYVKLLKEATLYKQPVFVSIRGDSGYDVAFESVEGGADVILLRCSNPVVEIPPVLDALRDSEARKKGVKLFVVSPLNGAEDILKLRALGADAVGFDMCEIFAKLKDDEGLRKYLNSLESELTQRMKFYGLRRLSSLNEEDLRALDYNTAALSGLKLIGYDRKLPMWLH